MQLTVNGNPAELPEPATLLALVESKGLDPAVVVAELNGAVVQGADFAATPLTEGDTLELLSFVGGG